jgi:hypothetical protein
MDATAVIPQSVSLRIAIYAAALSWADPSVLVKILPRIALGWTDIHYYEVRNIVKMLEYVLPLSGAGRNAVKWIPKELIRKVDDDIPATLMCTLYFRTDDNADPAFIRRLERLYRNGLTDEGDRSLVASVIAHYKTANWNGRRSGLPEISKYFAETTRNSLVELNVPYSLRRQKVDLGKILTEPFMYPAGLLTMADMNAAETVTGRLRPLREIALEEDWFGGLQY